MAALRMIKGPLTGRTFPLKSGKTVLGREGRHCDIVLDHHAVSRRHARIEVSADTVYIEDLGSHNGTFVNGRMLPPGVIGRMALQQNDRIEICDLRFVFQHQDSGGSSVIVLPGEFRDLNEILSTVNVASDDSQIQLEQTPAAKLWAVLRVIEQLATALDRKDVLTKILDSLLSSFHQAEAAFFLLRDSPDEELTPTAIRYRQKDRAEPIRVSRAIVDYVVERKSAVLSGNVSSDERFASGDSDWSSGRRSTICAPLLDRDSQVLGLIQLDTISGTQQFTEEDLYLLSGVARHVAIVIENSRLHHLALREQRIQLEERFQNLIESSLQGVLIHRQGRPLFVNEAWAQFHGYSVSEVLEMDSVIPLIAAQDRERFVADMQARLHGEELAPRHEYQGVRKDGRLVWFENLTTVMLWEGEPAIQTTILDISKRKQAEEKLRQANDELEQRVALRTADLAEANARLQAEVAERERVEHDLRKSEAMYQSLVQNLPVCVAQKDVQGRYTFVNQALCQTFAKTAHDFVGKTDFQLSPPELATKYRQDDQRVIETREVLDLLETIQPATGVQRHVHTIKSPIYGANQDVIGTQLIFWDITDHKLAQEQKNRYAAELERSNRDLEQFASIVSHDLQSPLRSVTANCQLLQRRFQSRLDAEANTLLASALEGAQRMRRMVEDLLAYSRVATHAIRFDNIDSRSALDDALSNLSAVIQESGARVRHDRLPTITADATQLTQLFQNLIGNAIKYRGERPPRIQVGAIREGDRWRFHVRDNGIGIDPKCTDRIFVIFQRLSPAEDRPGTGIGLAICQRIIQRHGGRIWVTSQPGEGSTFYFTIPVSMP